jgi:hypothetical protein
MGLLTSPRLSASIGGLTSQRIKLPSGGTWTIPGPEQAWWIKPGRYSAIQQRDPITGIWLDIGGSSPYADPMVVISDGQNFRVANQTGCAVGALVTTAGTGYTSVPTVTAGAGSSVWRAIVGGAVSTSVTVNAGGSNYTYPPIVVFSYPPVGGIPASGYCTISAGAVSMITVSNQGAGYVTPPTIQLLNDPREGLNGIGVGLGAIATATLTGAQTVTGVVCVDHGIGGQTAVPTLTFAGGGGSSAAATAIMCWTCTAYAVTSGGSGFSGIVLVSPFDIKFTGTSTAYTNPDTQTGMVKTRPASIIAALSAGAITATGQTVLDGGIFTAAPDQMMTYNTPPTGAASLTFTMGGTTDTIEILPI